MPVKFTMPIAISGIQKDLINTSLRKTLSPPEANTFMVAADFILRQQRNF
jgi:hypothetical protein